MKTSLPTLLSRSKAALFKKLSRRLARMAPEIALRGSAAVMALFALFGFNPQALAATDTWVGNTSVNWADSNWAASGNNPPAMSGDSLVFGVAGTAGSTLTDNLMTPGTYTINGITFSVGASAFTINPSVGTDGFTLGSATSILNASGNTETINDLVALTGTDTFTTDTTGGGLTFGGVISGAAGVNDGLLINGGGTVTFDQSAVNTYTGSTIVNAGTLNLNFANLSTPTNLINGGSVLNLGGGTLTVTGQATTTTSQTFASTTFASGMSTISAVAGASGVANVVLGALTHNAGSDVTFDLPAAGEITTGVAQTAGLLGYGVVSGSGNTTVTDFAGVSATGQIQSGKSLGLSAEYTTNTAAGNPVANDPVVEYDVNATGNQNIGNNAATANLLFDTNTTDASGWNFVSGSGNKTWNITQMLITSAVGDNNVTFNNGGSSVDIRPNSGGTSVALDQFNTGGEMIFNANVGIGNGGTTNLTQSGPGTVVFNTVNTYTGASYLNGGTTEISGTEALGSVGTANINLNGGSVVGNFTGNLDGGSSATAHPLVLGNNGGGLAATNGNTFTVDGLVSGTGALIIGNANTGGLVAGTGSGTPNAAAYETGTVIVSDVSNTFVGGTVIESGTLELTGTMGELGSGGITLNGGSFEWGSSNTTDISARTVTLAANGGTFNTNSNSPVLANSIGNSGSGGFTKAGAGTLTLNGNNTFTGAVTVSAGGLTLGGANVYTGATTVSSGATLTLNSGSSLGNTAMSVTGSLAANPGTGTGSGNIQIGSTGASLNLAAGASLNLTGTTSNVGTLTLNSTGPGTSNTVLTLGGTTATPDTLTFGIGSTGADELIANDGLVSFAGSPETTITLASFAGAAPSSLLVPLLYAPNATNFSISDFSLNPASATITNFTGGDYTVQLTLNGTTNELYADLTQAVVNLNFYWTGAQGSTTWATIGNFATDTTGTEAQSGSLGGTSNVFETGTDAANFSGSYSPQTVGASTINSLTFTGAVASSVALGSGTLTIDADSAFTDTHTSNNYATGIGLVVEAGAAANTISANINLGASQTWELDSANALTVSGTIAGATESLTKTGIGTLILSASNTYAGGTTVNAGTVQLSSGGSIGSAGTLTIQGTGTFDLAGNNQTVGGLSDGGVSTGMLTSSAGSATLIVNDSTPGTFSGTITDGGSGNSLSITFDGPSTETLSGNNSYTGLTTVSGGTLIATTNSALGSSTSAVGGLALNPSSGTATVDFMSATPSIASLASSGAGTSDVVLGNGTAHTATTLTVGGGGATTVFGGTISDANTALGAIGNLTVVGGSLTLGGTDTFTGTTIISGGTLILGSPLALENSTLNYNNQGGTLSFGTQTAATLAGLTGSENLTLENGSSAAVALTVGNSVADNYSGSLNGTGSLNKNGTDTLTLSNANYTGATTVNLGNLDITGGTVGSSSSAFAVDGNSGTAATASATISSGDLLASSLNLALGANQFGALLTISGNADATFSTSTNIGSGNSTAGGLLVNTTGSVSLGAVTDTRDTGTGLDIEAGTVTATSLVMIGDGATHGVTTTVSGGSLTIGNSASTGGFEVATAGGDLGQVLTVSGGALTYLGTDGLLLNVAATATSVELDGGVTSLTGITLDDVDSAALDSTLVVTAGATLYLGSVGLKDGSTPTVDADASVTLGTATVGALANWSTVVPLALTSGSTATFQAADSNSIAHNITLSGVLSGAGNVAVSGAGSVTLAAINTYTGTTAVNAGGTLIVSGSITGTSATTVASGGNLEVDGLLTSTAAAAVSGKLSGIGSLNGAAVSGAGSVLAPGLTEADASTATGTLTATENVSLASSATLSIRLGLTTGAASDPTTGLGGDVDQLFMNGGSFSLADSTTTLQILDTPAEFAAALDSIYVIVNGSASAPTGTFENALASGDTITTANNETFAVFYDVNAANTGAGNDIDVELVAVPEPGTWASLIGGIGMLVVWQRSRRRRA